MSDNRDQEIADLRDRLAALETPPNSQPVKKRVGCGAMALWGLGGLVGLAVIGSALGVKNSPTNTMADNTMANAEPVGSSPIQTATGNIINDALLKKSPAQQALILGKLVGEGCRGKHSFYDGIGHSGLSNREAFWSIACKSGKSYMVQISPDDKDNKVLECSIMHAIHAGECFTRF